MENFIKNKKKKLVLYRIVYITMIIVAIGSFALNRFGILISARGGNDTPLVAPCIGGAIAMIFQAVNIKKALKDEKKMKALYIAETDERMLFIGKSATALGSTVTMIVLFVCASIFAFINSTVYYTLFAVLIAWIVIMLLCELFYRKKY